MGVFGDEGVGVLGGAGEGGEVVGGADVAEGDADVAEEGGEFDAADGAEAEEGGEGGGVEGEEMAEGPLVDEGSGGEGGFAGGLGEAVPGASGEAVVAAVDAIAEGLAKFEGDGALVFDGEVGEAAAGVELVGGGDGLGGAGGEAAGAFAAVIVEGAVGGDFEGGEDFGEEEVAAEGGVDLEGAFAVPAEAGGGSPVAFEDGAGIGVEFLGAAAVFEVGAEVAEFAVEEGVVVVAPGVAGDGAGGGLGGRGMGVGLPVVEGEGDDGAGPGEDLAGVAAALGLAGHPLHGAVAAVVEPGLEGVGVGSGALEEGDAAVVEAEVGGEALQIRGEGGRVGGHAWGEEKWTRTDSARP